MAQPSNPYAAPSSQVADVSQADGDFVPGGHSVPSGNAWQWIVDGFGLFKRSPGIWILNLFILFILMVVLAVIPIVGGVALLLLLPVFGGGLMLGCDAVMRDEPLEVGHLFAGFRDKVGQLILVGVLYLVGSIVIGLIAGVLIGASVFGAVFSGGNVGASAATLMLGLLVALGLSVPLVMAMWFAPALIVFHDLKPMDALTQSFQGCLKNIVPFLVYGIITFVIGMLASIPAGLGWLIWGPTLIGSIYAGYRDIFLQSN